MTEHDKQEGTSHARVKYVCSAANSSHGYSTREARRSRKRDRCTRSLPVLGSSDLLAYTVYLFRAGQRELSLDRAAGRPGHTGMHYSWAENFVLQKLIVITGKLVHWGTSFRRLSVTMPSNNKPGSPCEKKMECGNAVPNAKNGLPGHRLVRLQSAWFAGEDVATWNPPDFGLYSVFFSVKTILWKPNYVVIL